MFKNSLFQPKVHLTVYIVALSLLVIGLPLSKFLMSVAQIALASNWLLEGNYKTKLKSFFTNIPALLLSSVFLMHLLGLFYTTDFDYASNDLRIKMPLAFLPLLISTSPKLSTSQFNTVLKCFISSIVLCTIISISLLLGIRDKPIVDIRDISIFISHIRFALLICIANFVCIYFIRDAKSIRAKYSWIALFIWTIVFLIILESLTGVAALAFTYFILFLYKLYRVKNKSLKVAVFSFLIVIVLVGIACIVNSFNDINQLKDSFNYATLEQKTSLGNNYQFDTTSTITENGHLVWFYYSDPELEETWNKRSKMSFVGKDLKNNDLRFTLMRFLASKGLRKDAVAVNSLSDEEIKSIENGVPNIKLQGTSNLKGRIYETLWEISIYTKYGDANGHSLTQRFEYWKTGLQLVKNNLWFGVGTGDVEKAFNEAYVENNSLLAPQWRLRAHNQYLTFMIAFGVIGFLFFLFSFIYPIIYYNKQLHFLFKAFFIIAMFSFLNEDTLETQAGVTFYAFFGSFFLFAVNNEPKKE